MSGEIVTADTFQGQGEIVLKEFNEWCDKGQGKYFKSHRELCACALGALATWQDCHEWHSALLTNNIKWWQMCQIRESVPSFRKLWEQVEKQAKEYKSQKIQETMLKCANGEYEIKKGYMCPDVKAGQVLLSAYDEAFREGGKTATATVNIQVNL